MTRSRHSYSRLGAVLVFTGKLLASLLLVAAAALAAAAIWHYYEEAPRTRDAHVRADVVGVTSDVGGLITEVHVHGNQLVHIGDLLFRIDPQRFEIAVQKAQAGLDSARAQLLYAQQQARRNRSLAGIVAQQQSQQTDSQLRAAQASVEQAAATLASARLDLERSSVRAPVNGIASNVTLRPGSYIAAGSPMLALVDEDSLRVEGYFQETRLEHIAVGDLARIQLIGDSRILLGHVTSISGAINDSDTQVGSNLLPSISPNFAWVRLAQRVPVLIQIDQLPAGLRLLPGRTATVAIEPPAAGSAAHPVAHLAKDQP